MPTPPSPVSRYFLNPVHPFAFRSLTRKEKYPNTATWAAPAASVSAKDLPRSGKPDRRNEGRHPVLSKAWFQLSADMRLCLPAHRPWPHRAHPGGRCPGLLRLSNCRRYQPLDGGSARPSPCSTP